MKNMKMLSALVAAGMSFAIGDLQAGETNAIPSLNATNHVEVPGYSFNHLNVPVDEVLNTYANLVGVKLTGQQNIPWASINFSTKKPLTRSETVKALEKVLREQASVVFKRVDEDHIAVSYDPSVKVK